MHVRLTPPEAVALARLADVELPRVVVSVTGDGDTVRVTADLRLLDDLPGPLRLAARVAPVVRAEIRVLGFADGMATIGVEVRSAGLPAHKLLRFVATPIEKLLTSKGLPRGAVDIRPDATVVVDLPALLAPRAPGVHVTEVRIDDGQIVVDATLD